MTIEWQVKKRCKKRRRGEKMTSDHWSTVWTSGNFEIELLFGSIYELSFKHVVLGTTNTESSTLLFRGKTFEACEEYLKTILPKQVEL